jgi:hypothetical protein
MTRVWSMAGLVLLGAGLAGVGQWTTGHVLALRNVLGYGHFALAYIFTWRLIHRQLGGRGAAGYVAVFLLLVAVYAVSQRVWLPPLANDVFVMSLFAVHHFANAILIRRQEANGYRPFTWTLPDTLVVALVTGLVLVERVGGGAVLLAWAACWAAYAWTRRHDALPAIVGWLALGGLALVSVAQPLGRPLFTSRLVFDWLVIYHYVLWYVFYTRKLLQRTGAWTGPRPRPSAAAVWTYLTTIPAGFVALAIGGNLLIIAALMVARPLADRAEASTHLDFFQVNTVAHILFGVGVARLAALRATWPAARATQLATVENRIVTSPAVSKSRSAP